MYILYSVFRKPPAEFEERKERAAAAEPGPSQCAPTGEKELQLRDPREVNVVVHEGRSLAAANADITALDNETFATEAPDRLEEKEMKLGELYIIKIVNDDFEHALAIGLGRCVAKPSSNNDNYEVQWFKRSSRTFDWPSNPAFRKAYIGTCPASSFLLRITDAMLTTAGL